MIYVNPIDILELQDKEVNEIDSSTIKKSKRRLFADIDLSDNGFYEFNGQKLTKSDCEKAIEELEDKNKIEFYSHLSTNLELNKFLANGNNELLNNLKQESIYKLPEFVDFISPFFSAKIDNILLKSFQSKDLELFSSALRAEHLISKSDLNKAYKSLSNEIQQRISETDKLTNSIKEEESNYTDDSIEEVVKVIKNRFPNDFLNKLPIYFQSQINKIAASINFLQLNIWNEFNTTAVPLKLLEHLLELNIESVSKPTFEKNYSIIKKKHEERIEQEKNAPLIKEWAKLLLTIKEFLKEFENGERWNSESLYDIVVLNLKQRTFYDGSVDYEYSMKPRKNFGNNYEAAKEYNKKFEEEEERKKGLGESKEKIYWLNDLPDFANEIRNQFGLTLRSMSIAAWNKENNIKFSLALIDLALSINLTSDIKSSVENDRIELKELEKKYKGVLVCHFCETNAPDKGCDIHTTIYKETSRSYIPRRVQFSYSDVTIPRCKSCKEIHSKGSSNYFLAFFGLLILGVIIGALTEGEHFIIGGIIGAVAGWIVGMIVEGNQVKKGGIKDASESTLSRHPLLIERIRDGWTFSKPSA